MADSTSPFLCIAALIKKLNINDDSIVMDNKIKNLTQDFLAIILENDYTVKDALQYFNDEALNDSNFAMNFAMLFSSKVFNNLVNVTKFRTEIMYLLQTNFTNADQYKSNNPTQFYNSITLLGEYYCRYRIAEKPVQILGKSLFELLTKQLQIEITCCLNDSSHIIDLQFSKLILTQISLNGSLARTTHKDEIDALLYEVRKCLIEVQNLTSHVKALFLMTLDLYYSNFASIGNQLETFYENFLNDIQEKTTTVDEQLAEIDHKSDGIRQTLTNALIADGIVVQQRAIQQNKILKEHIGKPLKASERLKLAQKADAVIAADGESDGISATLGGVSIDESEFEINEWNYQPVQPQIISKDAPDSNCTNMPNDATVCETVESDAIDDWHDEAQSGQSYLKPLSSLNVSKSCHEINSIPPPTGHSDQTDFEFKIFTEQQRNKNVNNQQRLQHQQQQTNSVNGNKGDRSTYFQIGNKSNSNQRRMPPNRRNSSSNNSNNRTDNIKHHSHSNNELHQSDLGDSKRFNVQRKPGNSRRNKNTSQTQSNANAFPLADEENWD